MVRLGCCRRRLRRPIFSGRNTFPVCWLEAIRRDARKRERVPRGGAQRHKSAAGPKRPHPAPISHWHAKVDNFRLRARAPRDFRVQWKVGGWAGLGDALSHGGAPTHLAARLLDAATRTRADLGRRKWRR